MQVTLEGKTYETKEFYDSDMSQALRNAQEYTSKKGFVAGMPQLIAWKASDHKSPLWNNWYTTTTEEHIIPDTKGRFGKKGQQLILVTQGHGILTPERIEKACREGLVSGAAQLIPRERDIRLLHSPLVRLYEEYDDSQKPPYTIVLTREQAEAYKSGPLKIHEFTNHPRVIAWAGGKQNLDSYFEKARISGSDAVCVWYDTANADTPRGRVLFLNDDDDGLSGDYSLNNNGRFVGVAPKVPQRARDSERHPLYYDSLDTLTERTLNLIRQPVKPQISDAPHKPTPIEITTKPPEHRDASLVKTALVVAGLGIATAGIGIAAIIYAAHKQQPTIVYEDINGDGIPDAIITVPEQKVILGEKY